MLEKNIKFKHVKLNEYNFKSYLRNSYKISDALSKVEKTLFDY